MDFMNKIWNLVIVISLIVIGFVTISCNSSLDELCADPIGSEGIVLKDSSIFCFSESLDGCFILLLQNQPVAESIVLLNSQEGEVIDIGIVSCLGKITTKPVDGYGKSVPLLLHHGYVVKLVDDTNGRFFVDSFVQAGSDEVVKVNVTWQYAF